MSTNAPTDEELRLLAILQGVCVQYMGGSSLSYIDHGFMSAGEHAVSLLAKYGLLVPDRSGGTWTQKACALEALDDLEMSNIELIRESFAGASASKTLSEFPGVNRTRPDVEVGSLRLWITGLAKSRGTKRPSSWPELEPDRLDVEARLVAVDLDAKIGGQLFTLAELQTFRDSIDGLGKREGSVAKLSGVNGSLVAELGTMPSGLVEGSASIGNPNFGTNATARLRFKGDHQLQSIIQQIDVVLTKFQPEIAKDR
ncbi:hypothetical protein A6F68_01687 [Tsuneonella dongtanensis]|uniref:Uncharacterized protein n=1 Tax=Tsuneonella dongtanensis TaxID=692370 RepID=A0A1B2ADG3_9SPHN|nr:hypothetical protein [Tsuneonella dongtanensis]ANY20200.1 hypothetical protein A6F68_01687 [Tsuneonella dongtanensis]